MKPHTRWSFFERVLTAPFFYEHSTSIVVRGDVSEVWSGVQDPQIRFGLDPSVLSSWQLASPHGRGEINAWLLKSEEIGNWLSADEVVEYEHEHRMVTNGLTFQGFWTRTETEIEPAGEGSARISHRWRQGFIAGATVRQVEASGQGFSDMVDQVPSRYARIFTVVSSERG